jgi:hypothetical protein
MKRYAFLLLSIVLIILLAVWLLFSGRTDNSTTENDVEALGNLVEIRLRLIVTDTQSFAVQNGRLPENLAALVDGGYLDADVIDDPFAPGNPIRYRKLGNGRFLLWSVGPDGKDDGGVPNLYESGVSANAKGDIALSGTVEHL